jgi:branched-subunit amino acid transport protein AzlD
LFDIGAVANEEPFTRLQNVGLILAEDGRKMSKRWNNVINPDEVVSEYGADAMRLYEMFMGPFGQSVAWSTESIIGSRRFIERVWNLQYKVDKNKKYTEFLKYVYLILSTSLIIFIIIMNYSSAENNNVSSKMNYIIYLLVIVLIFFGLIFSKKNIDSYSTATYSYNDGNKCTFKKKGILQTSGDKVKITFPFLVFIILLLFCYEPKELSTKNLYSFVYGILLGILVSSISYFGIEYFLQKIPLKECNDLSECSFKKIEIDNKYLEMFKKDLSAFKDLNILKKLLKVKGAQKRKELMQLIF